MSEYQWKTVSVVGFDELMQALERADRKGYIPDAIKEEWEAFNWEPEQPAQQEPYCWVSPEGTIYQASDKDVLKGSIPMYLGRIPAQRKPLTDEEISSMMSKNLRSPEGTYFSFARDIEAAHGIKENK